MPPNSVRYWIRSRNRSLRLLPMVLTILPHDTPITSKGGQSEHITITDPAHPLYGCSLPLVLVRGSRDGTGYAYVDNHGHAVLRLPIVATSLHPAPSGLPTSKLSLDAIRDLVRLAPLKDASARLVPQTSGPLADAELSSTITPPSSER
jgi:hypothetical protein